MATLKIPIVSKWLERRFLTLSEIDEHLDARISGAEVSSGMRVSEKTAVHNTAVYACVRILAETVASLPLIVYERTENGEKRRATEHPLYALLHDAPNPYMTSFAWRELLQAHLATWGNAYADIEWGQGGNALSIWPLRPDRMRDIKQKHGKRVYVYRTPDGTDTELPAKRVLHIAGMSPDGMRGYSPITLGAEAIGLSSAAEQYGARFFGNGARPTGVLQHPGKLSDQARTNLRDSWNAAHQGLSNAHRVAILEEGLQYQQIGIPPEAAQFLQTRKFQLGEIARLYRIPPHMLGDLDRSTWANIEHQAIDFVVHTVRPWLVRWEQTLNRQLLDNSRRFFAEFLVDGLLRGDIGSRYSAYATARQWGWLSTNDIRRLENMNSVENGDVYLQPLNMVEAGAEYQPTSRPTAESKTLELLRAERRTRTKGGAVARMRLATSFERVFADAAERIVRRETADIRRTARRELKERAELQFVEWLQQFYETAPAWITRFMAPAVYTYSEAVHAQAAAEVGAAETTAEHTEEMRRYLERWVAGYTASSRGQLEAILRDAAMQGVEPLALVEQRLDEWEERRPSKVAKNETVQVAGIVAKAVFAAAGVRRLRWVNAGDSPCPYCQEMDGRVVGIDEPFLAASGTLESEDGSMRLRKPTFEPPLHQGCICQVEAD